MRSFVTNACRVARRALRRVAPIALGCTIAATAIGCQATPANTPPPQATLAPAPTRAAGGGQTGQADGPAAADAVGTIDAGVFFDPTISTASDARKLNRAAIARLLIGWTPARVDDPAGLPATPGLDLTVRVVLCTSSLEPAGLVVHVVLAPLAAIPPRPDDARLDQQAAAEEWQALVAATEATAARNRKAAADAAGVVARYKGCRGPSDVAGAWAALTQTVPGGAGRRFAGLTDELDTAGGTGGELAAFAGATVLLVDTNTDGAVAKKQEGRLGRWLKAHGAAMPLRSARPETTDVLLEFVKEGTPQ